MNIENLYTYEKIYIEKKYKNHKNTLKILSRLHYDEIYFTNDTKNLINTLNLKNTVIRNKNLLLGGIRGEILQKCPGSHGHICCNYNVINLYLGCPINCQYCILQSYLNQPFTIINVNIEKIFNYLDKFLRKNTDKIYRIGTGELSDSLVFDPITDFSIDFINFFKNYSNAIFEFKTKTNFIDNIIKTKSANNIVIGFSMNPDVIINSTEGYSSCLKERLESAKKLTLHNYKIALHFDPIINIINFDIEYKNMIDLIFKNIEIKNIAWISLGTFRYNNDLKNEIEYNYPENNILSDEFLENADKKYRYFKPVRVTLYNKIINWIKYYDKNLKLSIYLCMESPSVWENTLKHYTNIEKNLYNIFH
ncbi:MAG: hypothetical protein JXB50_13415 [Spirochaetes bacterium]|nr:hypothetical protein [Spirochaetota bacterium]